MAKAKARAPFEIAGQTVKAGERLTFDLSVPDLYTHTGLSVPIHVFHGRQDGPVLFLSGAIHGDEIMGVEIIRRVLTSPRIRRLRGTLIAVPIVNIFGFINQVRYLPDRRDLNRMFPGSESGSLASRMANLFITEIVSRCTHGIDLHSGAINRENLPQIRALLDDPTTESMANAFGLPVILNTRIIDGSLRQTAEQLGISVITYESGEALRFDETAIRGGVNGVLSVMRTIGMIQGRNVRKTTQEAYVAKQTSWIRAPKSGIHRSMCALGARVKRGELLGLIASPLGEEEMEVTALHAGIVIGRTNLPLVNEGEALFHIATFDESTKEVAEQVDEAQQSLDNLDSDLLPPEPPIVG